MFADARGRIARFSSAPEDLANCQRLAGKAILPGLVNGHSHAFQRVLRGRTEHRTAHLRDSFWTWRESMYHAAGRLSPESLYHASRMAFLEMLLGGITTVGEFHYLHHAPDGTPYADRNELAWQVIRAARDLGLRIALLRTAYARSGWGQPPDPGQARFLTPRVEDFIAARVKPSKTEHSIPARKVLPELADDTMRPATVLRGARYKAGLTQKSLAKRLGVHQHHLSEMENGKRPIGKQMVKRFAEALSCDYRLFV